MSALDDARRDGWYAAWLGAMWMKHCYPGERLTFPSGLAARLLEESYLVRGEDGRYTMTPKGMDLVRSCDPKNEVLSQQPKDAE